MDVRTQVTAELARLAAPARSRRRYADTLPGILDLLAEMASLAEDRAITPDASQRDRAKAQLLDALLAVHTDTQSRLTTGATR